MLLLAAGCQPAPDDTADPGCVDAPQVTWESWGQGFLTTYCTSCHSVTSPSRYDAPVGVNFDTLDEVRTYAGAIRSAVVDKETMPVGGGITDDDRELLEVFLDCGL